MSDIDEPPAEGEPPEKITIYVSPGLLADTPKTIKAWRKLFPNAVFVVIVKTGKNN